MSRLTIIFWLGAILASIYGLYEVKWEVRELRNQNVQTEAAIIQQQQQINVLKAEWAYLTRPDRLKALTAKYLPQMQPMAGSQMVDVATIMQSLEANQAVAEIENEADSALIPAQYMPNEEENRP